MEGEEEAKTEADPGLNSGQVELYIIGSSGQRFQTNISGQGNEGEVVVVFCELRSQLR